MLLELRPYGGPGLLLDSFRFALSFPLSGLRCALLCPTAPYCNPTAPYYAHRTRLNRLTFTSLHPQTASPSTPQVPSSECESWSTCRRATPWVSGAIC